MLGTSRGPVDIADRGRLPDGAGHQHAVHRRRRRHPARRPRAVRGSARAAAMRWPWSASPRPSTTTCAIVSRTFGYGTAVAEAVRVIESAHTEARSVEQRRLAGQADGPPRRLHRRRRHGGQPGRQLLPGARGALRAGGRRRPAGGAGAAPAAQRPCRRRGGRRRRPGPARRERRARRLGQPEAAGHRPVPEGADRGALQGARHRDDDALLRPQLPDPRLPGQHRGCAAVRPHGPPRRARRAWPARPAW